MFKKIVLVAGVLGSMSVMMAAGCSSSSNGTTGGGGGGSDSGAGKDGSSKTDGGGFGGDGGGKGDGGGTHKDGGTIAVGDGGTVSHLDAGSGFDSGTTTADGGAIPACFVQADALVLNSTGPVAHQNKCNSTQITSIQTGCFGSAATTATCDAALAGAPDCGVCITGSFPDGGLTTASAVTVPIDSAGDVVPNTSGCIAALSAGDATCKYNFENQFVCANTACDTCADQASYDACLNYSSSDPGSICVAGLPTDSTCVDAINAVGKTAADNQCGFSDTTFDAAFPKVALTLCGP